MTTSKTKQSKNTWKQNTGNTDGNPSRNARILGERIMLRDENENRNVLCMGGSDKGRTFHMIAPNILQRRGSMVIHDMGGKLLSAYGSYLEYHGYQIKCMQVTGSQSTETYNLFAHVKTEDDLASFGRSFIAVTEGLFSEPPEQQETHAAFLLFCAALWHAKKAREKATFSELDLFLQCGGIYGPIGGKEENPYHREFLNLPLNERKEAEAQLKERLRPFLRKRFKLCAKGNTLHPEKLLEQETAMFLITEENDGVGRMFASLLLEQWLSILSAAVSKKNGCAVLDADKQVIRYFPGTPKRSKEQAEEFLHAVRHAEIMENPALSTEDEHARQEFWEIVSSGHMLAHFGAKALAEAKLRAWKKASISTEKEAKTSIKIPIDVFLDHADALYLPSMPQLLAQGNGTHISFVLMFPSLNSIKACCREQWQQIASGCRAIVYLGSGTEKNAKNSSVEEPPSVYASEPETEKEEMHVLPGEPCRILLRGQCPHEGTAFRTTEHPGWELKESLPVYRYATLGTG